MPWAGVFQSRSEVDAVRTTTLPLLYHNDRFSDRLLVAFDV